MNLGTFGATAFPQKSDTPLYQPANYATDVLLGSACVKGDLLVASALTGNATVQAMPTPQTYVAAPNLIGAGSISTGNVGGASACYLTDGTFVVGYNRPTDGFLTFDLKNSAGVNILTSMVGGLNMDKVSVAPLSNGNFVIASKTYGGSTLYAGIFNSAGTQVVAVTIMSTNLVANTILDVVQLSNTDIAFVYSSATDIPTVLIRTLTLTASVAEATVNGAVAGNNSVTLCALTGGGFAVSYQATGVFKYVVYANNGTVTKTATTAHSTYTSSSNSTSKVASLATGGFAYIASCTSYTRLRYETYDSAGTLVLASTLIYSNVHTSYPIKAVWAALLSTGETAISWINEYVTTMFMVVNISGSTVRPAIGLLDSAGVLSATAQKGVATGPAGSFSLIASYSTIVKFRVSNNCPVTTTTQLQPLGQTAVALASSAANTLAATAVYSSTPLQIGAIAVSKDGSIATIYNAAASSYYSMLSINSGTGAVVLAPTTLASTHTARIAQPCALSDGSFVTIQSEGSVVWAKRYSMQGGDISVTLPYALTPVNFPYYIGSGPDNTFAVMNSAGSGTLELFGADFTRRWGSFVTLSTGNSASTLFYHGGVSFAPDGNIGVAYLATTTSYPTFGIYDITGRVVLAPITLSQLNPVNGNVQLTTLSNGNFLVAYLNGNTTPHTAILAQYSSSGTLVSSSSYQFPVNQVMFSLCALTGGGYAIAASASNNIRFFLFDNNNVNIASSSLIGAVTSSNDASIASNPVTGGFSLMYTTQYVTIQSFNGILQPIMGVADGAGVAGGTVKCITQGVATLASSVGPNARVFDYQGCTPSGLKGALTGNSAVLKGFQ